MAVLILVLLFVVVPVAVGYAIRDALAARIVWLGLGALMAYSQSQDDELGGMWVLVGLFVLLGLLLVELGHRVRTRDARS